LYKYRSLRGLSKTFTRDLLTLQKLYFPTPPQLNDPFEFRPVVDVSSTAEERKEYVKGLVKRTQNATRAERRRITKSVNLDTLGDTLAESYRRVMDRSGVFSMSARPTDLLMWPHYADDHAGVCVRFDLLALTTTGHPPFPVKYHRHRPIAYPMFDEPREMLEKVALCKGLPWSYEEEWRILLDSGGGRVLHFEAPVISGVILGARISAQDRQTVLDWVAACHRPMEALQARIDERDFALTLEPVA
jgi:hypothetical protein